MGLRIFRVVSVMVILVVSSCHAQKSVPTQPPSTSVQRRFRDSRNGVRFRVPPGWSLNRHDGQVSTFRLDARSAVRRSQMRAVATLDFNPYPLSTLSGASFYYSVERGTTDWECEQQAVNVSSSAAPISRGVGDRDIQNIGGMNFAHGHDEHGSFCVEARDEVYTAYRRGACYRFDLTVNTFCSETSGAEELTIGQLRDIEGRMTGILSTVALDWEKGGPTMVTVPQDVVPEHRQPIQPDEPVKADSKGLSTGR